MTSHKHIVTNQEEYDDMVSQVNGSERGSHHLICFHGHGNKEKDDFIKTINPNANPRCIFIKDANMPRLDLNYVIETALEDNKCIYIIAISCFWNEKYKKGLTIPTISFAPDEVSRLPYMFETLVRKINNVGDDFDKEIMTSWFINLKKEFNMLINCWEIHDENGNVQIPGGYVLKYNDSALADDDSWDSVEDEDKRMWDKKYPNHTKNRIINETNQPARNILYVPCSQDMHFSTTIVK